MKKILIIDDEKDFRELLGDILGEAGYEVLFAENGKKALKITEEVIPDLVITDIIMPEMEGVETTMALSKKIPGIKIIAISGGGEIEPGVYLDSLKELSPSVKRTFLKPIKRNEIIQVVQEVLDES